MAWATKDAKDLQSQQPKPTATPVQSKHTDKIFVQHHATTAQMNLLPLSIISRRLRAAIDTEGAHHESVLQQSQTIMTGQPEIKKNTPHPRGCRRHGNRLYHVQCGPKQFQTDDCNCKTGLTTSLVSRTSMAGRSCSGCEYG